MIGESGEEVPEAPDEAPAPVEEKAAVAASAEAPRAAGVSPGRVEGLGFISPVVARIAAAEEVDLSRIDGSGRGGRITKKDVLAYIETREEAAPEEVAPWEEPASGELFRPTEEVFKGAPPRPVEAGEAEVQKLDPIRKSIAEHMVRSKHTSPHVTTVMEADLGRVVEHRNAHKEEFDRSGIKLTYSAYFAHAAVRALTEVPLVNSSWSEEGVVLHARVNLGMAVSLADRGLIVPVIREADGKSLRGLSAAINDLAGRARSGDLEPAEVQGGTFTITNHGVSGSLFATPIINQPQCAILGVGAVQKRAVVVELEEPGGAVTDGIAIRPMVYLTMTFDHRILDGAIADHFLGLIVRRLEGWS